MPFKFNIFTGNLDVVNAPPDQYIDGEVEYHSSLPVSIGSPAVNSAFLVRKGEGIYFLTRRPAGIWVRELNNGNLDDWKYAGTFSDLYRDANFRIINDADASKELAFDVSGVTSGQTRTLTVPDKSGTIATTSDLPDDYTVVSTAGNLANGNRVAANTTSASFTLTLPASPANGDTIYVLDYAGTFQTNNLTIGRNGNNIESLAEDLVCNVEKAAFSLVYAGSTVGWKVVPQTAQMPSTQLANTWQVNQTFNGTNNVAPNQTAASGSSIMTRDLVDARSGRVLFYQVSSAISANSTAKVFDSTTLTIPTGTYEVQAHGRAIYNGSNGGWSFGVERASGNSGTATALIFQHIGESGTFNNTGGAYRASPTLNLFGGTAILAASATSGTSLHRTGQAAASGLLVVTSELVVVWYVAQIATDASNATTLDANSFLMLTKVA